MQPSSWKNCEIHCATQSSSFLKVNTEKEMVKTSICFLNFNKFLQEVISWALDFACSDIPVSTQGNAHDTHQIMLFLFLETLPPNLFNAPQPHISASFILP